MINKYLAIAMFILIAVVAYFVGKRTAWFDELDRWEYLMNILDKALDKINERDHNWYLIRGCTVAYEVVVEGKELEIVEENT